jgi:predicted DNA-binding ribbon-helix-helix protein
LVSKRTVKIGGRRVDDAFWDVLKHIAAGEGIPIYELVSRIDLKRDLRDNSNLSSAKRVFILEHYRGLAEAKG